jgi:hypothetical protein
MVAGKTRRFDGADGSFADRVEIFHKGFNARFLI